MLDPFFSPPPFLTALSTPIAQFLNLATLPLHIHEVILAATFYNLVFQFGAPYVSARLFPTFYPRFNARTKTNWDVRVVSLVQSSFINILTLWAMWRDEERRGMDWEERIWGYTGAGGMIQGFAAGYFLWDFYVCSVHVKVFGWGMLAHAISALVVFSFGFRPFLNFYGPTFILYELSSPFLNFHWFFDKVDMTGSRAQLYNGLFLLATFFSCRLLWGTYQSVRVYQDVWAAIQTPGTLTAVAKNATMAATERSVNANSEVMRFAGEKTVPVWLAVTYLGSNIVLNTLNFYWFGKMIETVKKRFQPTKEKEKEKLPMKMNGGDKSEERGKTEIEEDGTKVVSAEKKEVRRRRG
ncbi:hypothetical protein MMC14_002281 [Varicellaria rhodocarpa]|nr:hypothetical protein [Varicellaria rhodocarpa]